MKNDTMIKTLTEVLKALPTADTWTWHRGDFVYSRGALSIYIDDIPGDRREVYQIELPKGGPARIELTVLCDYDSEKLCWKTEVRRYRGDTTRRGEKALREYIKTVCERETGYPTPNMHAHYSK